MLERADTTEAIDLNMLALPLYSVNEVECFNQKRAVNLPARA
jgi:hypothetical protein